MEAELKSSHEVLLRSDVPSVRAQVQREAFGEQRHFVSVRFLN